MIAAGLAALVLALMPAAGDESSAPFPSAATFADLGDDAVQDLVILGETRPILLRLRAKVGDRPFRAAWAEATREMLATLDRDKDGRVTVEEADKGGLMALLAAAGATPTPRGPAEIDIRPKDGVISADELAESLRSTPAGPFRLQAEGLADRRTDALFDHLDRDKDGRLSRSELAALVGSLRRLDRDADELISTDEIELLAAPSTTTGRPGREPAVPPVLALSPEESPVRLARLLIKKYDAGSSRGPGRRDAKLSPEEFAIPADAFAAADTRRDGTLDAEELRAYLAKAPRDAVLDVALSRAASGRAGARARGEDGGTPEGLSVRQLAEGLVEIDAGPIRLDILVDDGAGAVEATRRALKARFEAADSNQDGYVERDEVAPENGQASPLSALFAAADADGDGKLYPRELDDFVTRQAASARGRLALAASDEGRSLFGLLDLDRDGRLGAREVLEASARVAACDRDRDGAVTPEEVPHHIQLTLVRGDLSPLLAPPVNGPVQVARPRAVVVAPRPSRPASGPPWFRRMDRNRDGDVSPREFLGTRAQFDRLDRDGDGLLSPEEAEAASRGVKAPGG
jgi:Ca2+-binding EF-hand superfamily protein